MSTYKKQHGFTLVELAIVMAIISLIVAGALGAYKVQVAKEYRDTTQDRIYQIRLALTKYKTQNDRIPCPARLDAAPNSPDFGVEDVPTGQTCSTATPSAGTFRTASTLNLPVDPLNTVRIGAVPVKELGLPQELAFDSWGRRFVYAASERLADNGVPYSATNGTITVLNAGGVSVAPQDRVPFVVLSYGKNGRGAVTYEGKMFPTACPTLAASPENENCNLNSGPNDTTFRDTIFAETNDDNTHFDDYIGYTFVDDAGGFVKNIDDLGDGISDWPELDTAATNVFLGKGSGQTHDQYNYIPHTTVTKPALGAGNTGVGLYSLYSLSPLSGFPGGSHNTAVGLNALNKNTIGNRNTAIGMGAMSQKQRGDDNVAIGASALPFNTLDSFNTFVGSKAGLDNTLGGYQTAVGGEALQRNFQRDGSTAVGYQAMRDVKGANTTAQLLDNNTAIGYQAYHGNAAVTPAITQGRNNTALGALSLKNMTIGVNNTASGVEALGFQSNTVDSTATGYRAAFGLTAIPSYSVAVGAYALEHGAQMAIGIGYRAAQNSSGAGSPVAVGYQALHGNTTGAHNVALGNFALMSNTTQSQTVAIGTNAGRNSMAQDNTMVGTWAGWNNTSAVANTFVGAFAGAANGGAAAGTGPYNTSVGAYSMRAYTTARNNAALGTYTLSNVTTGSYNTALGYSVMHNTSTGGNNVGIGNAALHANTTGADNIAIGSGAVQSSTTASRNIAIGRQALTQTQTSEDNVAIGYQSLMFVNNSNWGRNVAVGNNALRNTTSGHANVAVGTEALNRNTVNHENTAVGYRALASQSVAIFDGNGQNTAVGSQALANANGAKIMSNTAIGSHALISLVNGWNNTAVGQDALGYLNHASNADNNTALGMRAGYGGVNCSPSVGLYTGSNNTFIGHCASTSNGAISNSMALGNFAVVDASNQVRIGNADITHIFANVPITTTSDARLKKDVENSDLGVDFISKLRPVSYVLKRDETAKRRYGLIAQEVEASLGKDTTNLAMLHRANDTDKTYSMNYEELISPIIKAIQELLAKIEAIIARLNPLEATVKEQAERIDALEKTIAEMRAEMKEMKGAIKK